MGKNPNLERLASLEFKRVELQAEEGNSTGILVPLPKERPSSYHRSDYNKLSHGIAYLPDDGTSTKHIVIGTLRDELIAGVVIRNGADPIIEYHGRPGDRRGRLPFGSEWEVLRLASVGALYEQGMLDSILEPAPAR